ncbi:MAG: glucosaminidase domain-containing protein [Erysipelotrichaceae bacterium]|nr:glucosaminidase domain-containing protein [Erysipelotrichaceae bacterium]
MSCPANQFEVSYINDDGSLSKVSCHDTFNDAKNAMKANKDYVVRYSKSYSPTKIVAMNDGLAYSYPGRRNSSTMYLIQNPSDRNSSLYKNTYISNHYEMFYIKTCDSSVYDIAPAGKGYIRVNMNGFDGFTDLEYTDLVPRKYIDNNIPIWLGGNNTYENEGPFQVKVHQNYYQIEKNGNYYDLVFHYYRAYPKGGSNGNDALSYTLNVDNAQNYLDAGMQTGVKYYSSDGINFYSDPSMKNYVTSCYNYYQFLPLRSKTDISTSSFNAFLKSVKSSGSVMYNQASAFINAQNTYGCNALLVYAMACLESSYGTSGYAVNRNNLFGWSAYDDSPNNATYFSSIQVCVNEQMGRNLNWFMDYTNRRYFGTGLGNKGAGINVNYASDPYWGMKIAAIAYSIDKYANNSNGHLTDHNKYTLGFVKGNYNDILYGSNVEWDSKIYKKATGNDILYTGRYGSHYQKDLIAIVLDQDFTNNRYKIQSTNAVTNGSINTDDGLIAYDFSKSVGYIKTSDVTLLYGKSFTDTSASDAETPTYKPITSIRSITIEDDVIYVKGIGAIHGMNFKDTSAITHTINIRNIEDDSVIASLEANTIDSEGYTRYDGYDYQYSGFEAQIALDEAIPQGSYYIELNVQNGERNVSSYLYSSEKDYRHIGIKNGNQSYRIRMNDFYNYRFELDVLSMPESLDVTQVNKPSARPSLASLDSISLDEEGNLAIRAHAFIYYLNYTDIQDITYQMFLVDSEGDYKELNVEFYDDPIDYQTLLFYSYDLDHISFTADTDVTDLPDGRYTLYLKMTKKDGNDLYADICEIVNYGFELDSRNIGDRAYSLVTSRVRSRIELLIGGDSNEQ